QHAAALDRDETPNGSAPRRLRALGVSPVPAARMSPPLARGIGTWRADLTDFLGPRTRGRCTMHVDRARLRAERRGSRISGVGMSRRRQRSERERRDDAHSRSCYGPSTSPELRTLTVSLSPLRLRRITRPASAHRPSLVKWKEARVPDAQR